MDHVNLSVHHFHSLFAFGIRLLCVACRADATLEQPLLRIRLCDEPLKCFGFIHPHDGADREHAVSLQATAALGVPLLRCSAGAMQALRGCKVFCTLLVYVSETRGRTFALGHQA